MDDLDFQGCESPMVKKEYPYFLNSELECKCGCCLNVMHPDFMDKLIRLRILYARPITLSSAYRCPKHNKAVSKTGLHGPHTTGMAVDIAVNGQDAYELLRIAYNLGFVGIGIKQSGDWDKRFIHLDMIPGQTRPRVWTY